MVAYSVVKKLDIKVGNKLAYVSKVENIDYRYHPVYIFQLVQLNLPYNMVLFSREHEIIILKQSFCL